MVIVEAEAGRLAVLLVTTGITVATCVAVPPVTLFVVTIAVRLPAEGLVEKVIVREVAVAEVTVPTAPFPKATILLAAVVSNPSPAIVIVVALPSRLLVLLVKTGLTTAI